MKSTARRSSSSGWLGGSPWVPKSSSVSTIPEPNSTAHVRFTATRAVSGLRRSTSHFASVMRSTGPSGFGPSAFGKAGPTSGPGSRKFPFTRIFVTRRLSAGSSAMIGSVGTSAFSFSTFATSSFSALSSGLAASFDFNSASFASSRAWRAATSGLIQGMTGDSSGWSLSAVWLKTANAE